jgi:hypothetical protein
MTEALICNGLTLELSSVWIGPGYWRKRIRKAGRGEREQGNDNSDTQGHFHGILLFLARMCAR